MNKMIRLLTMLCMMTALPMLAGNTNENRRRLLGASDENPVDATWLITNPSFETGDLTGWTMTPSEGSDMGARDYDLSDRDGNFEANLYTWWSGVAIEQVVGEVPAGIYELSALVATWEGYTVNFYANDHMVSAAGQGDCTGIRLATTVIVGSDGRLSIRADRTDINWWAEDRKDIENTRLGFLKLDDVRLTCKGLLDVSEQSDFTAAALNVDGLPSIINNDGPGSKGTKLISTYLKNKGYDIIGFSEDFDYHDELKSNMTGYSWGTYRGSVNVLNLLTPANTDGLELAWNTNTIGVTNESWTQWSHSESGDGNQYIKKGFRHYDMTLDGGQVIDVYVLHMDAGDVPQSREQQWSQMADVVNAADPNRPKLIIGDTNSRWTREEIKANFTDQLTTMTAKDAWVEMRREGVYPTTAMNDLADQTFVNSLGTYEVVDKILYLNPTAENTLQLVPKGFRLEQDYTYGTVEGTEDGKQLGDHRPLAVDFSCMRYKKVTTKIGDVNRDGSITIADLTAQVNLILSNGSQGASGYDRDAADMNADGKVTTEDIEPLVNLLLDK